MKIRISKTTTNRGATQIGGQMGLRGMMPPKPRFTTALGLPAVTEADVASKQPAKSSHREVKSPMGGTYYGAPEPGAKPYVTVGSTIKKGQILCIIEAMKIMNEIESEFSGVVKEISATDAHPVEYGQVLFRIDPNG